MTLPNTHSFYVNEPDLDEARAMAAALGYTATEALVLPKYYVTWRKVGVPIWPKPEIGEIFFDGSEHNWPIDFKAAKAAGVKRVYGRATLGKHGRDKRWLEFRNGALDAGLSLGAYHYFIWNEDGRAQAENFKDATLDFCTEGGVGDAERRRNRPDPNNPTGPKLPELVDKAEACENFLALMNNLAGPDAPVPGIYSNKIEWETMFNLSAAAVERWWKWIAHYRNGTSRWSEPLHLAQPAVPAGWWARVHQYRIAEPGELTWHPRALDLNVYRGELDPGLVGPTPTDPPPAFKHLMRDKTNQGALNVFFRAFGVNNYWPVVVRAGIAGIATNRQAFYAGPALEDMPLTAAEIAALVAALG